MNLLFTITLFAHIAAGTSALLSGTTASLTQKGSRWHVRSGRLYYWSMLAVAVSAFGMAVYKFNPLLLLLSVFAFYMTFTGQRALLFRRQQLTAAAWPDWLMLAGGAAVAVSLPFVLLQRQGGQVNSWVFIISVFALIFCGMIFNDLRTFRKPTLPDRTTLLRLHITRMGGAMIGTFTAFLVVNVSFQPVWVPWLAPTLVGTLCITYAVRKYTVRKKNNDVKEASVRV